MKQANLLKVALLGLTLALDCCRRADADEMKRIGNDFACDLLRAVSAQEGNLVFAPQSVSSVLKILEAGATGETETQIQKVLHESPKNDAVTPNQPSVRSAPGVEFKSANQVWYRSGISVEKSFQADIKHRFSADLVQFENVSAVTKDVNDWASAGTNGKIPQLFSSPLDSDTQLVIANYVYFKAEWAQRFNPKSTAKGRFFLKGNEQVNVRMMTSDLHEWRVWSSPDTTFTLIDLPYKGNDFSAVVLLPAQHDGLARIQKDLTGKKLDEWLGHLDKAGVQKKVLKLPSFQFASELPLNELLKQLGLTKAFQRDAELTRISHEHLHVFKTVHKALVKVDEYGSEAAGISAVAVGSGLPINTIVVDRPFLFLIRDRKQGIVHYVARIIDPS